MKKLIFLLSLFVLTNIVKGQIAPDHFGVIYDDINGSVTYHSPESFKDPIVEHNTTTGEITINISEIDQMFFRDGKMVIQDNALIERRRCAPGRDDLVWEGGTIDITAGDGILFVGSDDTGTIAISVSPQRDMPTFTATEWDGDIKSTVEKIIK